MASLLLLKAKQTAQMKINAKFLKNQKGFTLIELIVIVVIVGVLSYVVIANYSGTHNKLQYEAMIKKIAADVKYARSLALTEGKGARVYIDQANNRYYLKWDDGSYIKNPVGGKDFVVQLGQDKFSAVQITATAFSGGRLDFSTSGSPSNAGSSFAGELNLVSLNNAKKIMITANTGFIRIEDL